MVFGELSLVCNIYLFCIEKFGEELFLSEFIKALSRSLIAT